MALISSEEIDKQSDYIAFFDLDRTITPKISGKVLAGKAYKNGLMTSGEIFKAALLLLSYKLRIKDPVEIMSGMTLWVKGLPEEILNDLCVESARSEILPSVWPEAVSEILMHKRNNASTVLLSSSIVPLCREIAEKLGMDDIICTALESTGGYYTGRTDGQLCYGKEKAVRLLEYCKRNNSDPENAWYYGDSLADLPALSIVGRPVCVNPERKLLKRATEKGWKILNWQSEKLKSD